MAWIIFAAMTGAVLACVLWPLGRRCRERSRNEADVAFYRSQLAELDRDAARGIVAPAEAALARTEVARRLLAVGSGPDRPQLEREQRRGARRRRLAAACFMLVVVPLVAVSLYARLGSPNLPDEPLQARLQAAPADMDIAVAVARIETHLAAHPDDGKGYEVIAPVYLRLGRFQDAAKAYSKALALLGDTPERQENYGEALVAAAGGTVNSDARQAFEAALARDPSRPKARYYLGLAAEQAGDKARATGIFTKLLAEAPQAAWASAVRRRLAELGAEGEPKGATADQAAAIAALPARDREAAIRGMVDRLAQRLARDGRDAEGWLRLVRAYAVMSQNDKARTALADARRSLADDHAALARLDDLARELGLGGS